MHGERLCGVKPCCCSENSPPIFGCMRLLLVRCTMSHHDVRSCSSLWQFPFLVYSRAVWMKNTLFILRVISLLWPVRDHDKWRDGLFIQTALLRSSPHHHRYFSAEHPTGMEPIYCTATHSLRGPLLFWFVQSSLHFARTLAGQSDEWGCEIERDSSIYLCERENRVLFLHSGWKSAVRMVIPGANDLPLSISQYLSLVMNRSRQSPPSALSLLSSNYSPTRPIVTPCIRGNDDCMQSSTGILLPAFHPFRILSKAPEMIWFYLFLQLQIPNLESS